MAENGSGGLSTGASVRSADGGEQAQSADEAISALLDRLDPPVAEDDVCLLAVRVR